MELSHTQIATIAQGGKAAIVKIPGEVLVKALGLPEGSKVVTVELGNSGWKEEPTVEVLVVGPNLQVEMDPDKRPAKGKPTTIIPVIEIDGVRE